MRVFLDTSLLVAAFWGDHPCHATCLAALRSARADRAFCALHSLAEVYAVMTRLPVRPAIPPDQAMLFLESLRNRVSAVALRESEYRSAIGRAAANGISGGAVYDALILECARKCRADRIYTLNERNFRRLAADLADRIIRP